MFIGLHLIFKEGGSDTTLCKIRMLMLPLRCLIKTPAIFIKPLLISLFLTGLPCTRVYFYTDVHAHPTRLLLEAIYRAVSLPSPGLWPWRERDKWQAAFQQKPSHFNNDCRSEGEIKNNAVCTGLFLFTHEIPFLNATWIIDSHGQSCAGVLGLKIWNWSTG